MAVLSVKDETHKKLKQLAEEHDVPMSALTTSAVHLLEEFIRDHGVPSTTRINRGELDSQLQKRVEALEDRLDKLDGSTLEASEFD